MAQRREDEDGISGGKFINPGLLPPVRTVRLQGGRFVPASEGLLPPVREYEIGMDWENAYHFGQIGAATGITFTFGTPRVEYPDGSPVTQVPAGQPFFIKIPFTCTASVPAGEVGKTVGASVIDTQAGTVYGFDLQRNLAPAFPLPWTLSASGTFIFANNRKPGETWGWSSINIPDAVIMPASNITLRFKGWFLDEAAPSVIPDKSTY